MNQVALILLHLFLKDSRFMHCININHIVVTDFKSISQSVNTTRVKRVQDMISPSEFLKWISLEPAIFLLVCGQYLVTGSNLQVDLLIWKICRLQLNYTEEVCANLTNDGFEDINDKVQERVNNFLMISQWLGGALPIIYLFFAGALIDKFGCKPFFLFSLTGLLLKVTCELINYAFIEDLPLEFFYMENIHAFFGGSILYYLCHFTYGTLVSIEYDMNR